MRLYKTLIILLFILPLDSLSGQEPTVKDYGRNDGITEAEFIAGFMLSDTSFYYKSNISSLKRYDGYVTETDSTLEKMEMHASRIYPLTTGDFVSGDRHMYLYKDGSFTEIFLPEEYNSSKLELFLSRDTTFLIDSNYKIYYFDEYEHVFKQYGERSKLVSSIIGENQASTYYVESLLTDSIIRLGSLNYIQNALGGYSPLSMSKLHLKFPAIRQYVVNHGLTGIEIDYAFLFHKLLFPSKINPINKTSIAVHPYLNSNRIIFILDPTSATILSHVIAPEDNQRYIQAISNELVITSSHAGLKKINNSITFFSAKDDNMIEALHTIQEGREKKIFLGGYGQGFSQYKNGKLSRVKLEPATMAILPGSFRTENGNVLYFKDGPESGLKMLDGQRTWDVTLEGLNYERATGYFIDRLSSGQLAFGLTKKGLGIELDRNESSITLKCISKEKGLLLDNVLHWSEDRNQRIWCGRFSQGVAIYDTKRDTAFSFLIDKNVKNSFGSLSSTIDKNGNLWLGTTLGLKYLAEPHNFDLENEDLFNTVKHVELPNGDNKLIHFMTTIDNYVVFGNSTAVSFLDLASFEENPASPIIYQLIYGEDILGNGSEQNCVLFDSQRRLWIGSQEGASMIDWDNFTFDKSINKIKIRKVISGGEDLTWKQGEEIRLPKDNRNCTIYFGPEKNVTLTKNIFFDYYLINNSGDTITSKNYDQNGVFEQAYIPAGEYKLKIDARKHGQLMQSLVLPISAPLSMTESPWFWSFLVLFIMGLVLYFFSYRSKQQKKILMNSLALSRTEKEMDKLKKQAIISSLNPHFINNSLHWVQSRYRKDEVLVSMIGGLSENIAKILGKTSKNLAHHSIKEELVLVQNYVDIQLIRFKNSFEFKIDNRLKSGTMQHDILLMHLQIHIENAIEHGLRNRDQASYVSIKLTENKEQIEIYIEDDGCGRELAKKIGSSAHKWEPK